MDLGILKKGASKIYGLIPRIRRKDSSDGLNGLRGVVFDIDTYIRIL